MSSAPGWEVTECIAPTGPDGCRVLKTRNEGVQSKFSYEDVYPNSELAYTLYAGGGERYWMGSWLDGMFSPRFSAGKTYQVSLRFKAENVAGPNSYSGLVINMKTTSLPAIRSQQ